MTSGISAIGGSARKKLISGSMNVRTLLVPAEHEADRYGDQHAQCYADHDALRGHPDVGQQLALRQVGPEHFQHRRRRRQQGRVDQAEARSTTQKLIREMKGSSAQPKSLNKLLR